MIGHRSHRFREAARTRCLLADATAAQRHSFVVQARGLSSYADLEEHERRAVDRRVEVACLEKRAAVARSIEHTLGESSDDVEALGVDVVQRNLVDVELGEMRHELRRVRRPGADDGQFHPFTPVSVTPSTKAFCARKNSTITGAMTSSVAAMVRFHCTWCSDRNSESPICSTQWCGFSPV